MGGRAARRWWTAVGAALVVAVATVAVPSAADAQAGPLDPVSDVVDPPETYPDLVPDIREVHIFQDFVLDEHGEIVLGPPKLAFDTWAQNLGTVAVDLLSDDPTNLENPAVSQCVAWTSDVCRERRTVGGFEVHVPHAHMHFLDFARYELRRVHPSGRIDMTDRGLLDVSETVSFCLFDAGTERDDARPIRRYMTCSATQQGISPGWTDVYGAGLPGQQLVPAGGLVDGVYAIVLTMDHGNRVWESDNSNNTLVLVVEVEDDASRVSVREKLRP